MTVRVLGAGIAAVAAIGAAGMASAPPTTVQVRAVVFGAPLPLDPAPEPPAPPAPAPGAPEQGAPLPSTDEVSGLLTKLTDAGISYKEKGNLVENGIAADEGHVLDHNLRKSYRHGDLPYTFDVADVAPAGPGQAVANVTISGPNMAPETKPVQLVQQGGWVLSHDSAVALVQALAPQ